MQHGLSGRCGDERSHEENATETPNAIPPLRGRRWVRTGPPDLCRGLLDSAGTHDLLSAPCSADGALRKLEKRSGRLFCQRHDLDGCGPVAPYHACALRSEEHTSE